MPSTPAELAAEPQPRTITRTNPKGHDIRVSGDGRHYSNEAFAIEFQGGLIPRHGVRNGAFEEEILAVLIDRAQHDAEPDAEYLGLLTQAHALLVGPVPPAAATTA